MKKSHLLALILTHSILLLLFSLLTTSVQAQPPSLIGDPAYKQRECFDSNPTTGGTSGTGLISPPGATVANVFDGNLTTNINWVFGASPSGFVNVTSFKKPSDQDTGLADFNITYIDIKIHYRAYAIDSADDEYRIVFYLGGDTVELQTWVAGKNAKWPNYPSLPQTRVFSNVAKPGGGNWTWTDITNLKIGFENRVVGTNNFGRLYLHEIWITAYSTPYPEASTMSVQPPIIWGLLAGNPFYIDIYVTNVTNAFGYEFVLSFNPAVLTPTAWHTYNPFVTQAPSEIGPDFVYISYYTHGGDPVGFTGNTPICRIYFQINIGTGSPLRFRRVYWEDVQSNPFTLTTVDGYYRIGEGDFESPTIESVSATPLPASYQYDVTVKANVTDNIEIDNVTLSYHQLASEWHNTTMILNAGLFKAVIPAQPYLTHIEYKVYANDTSANSAVSDTYSYIVGDNVKPQISTSRKLLQPRQNQTTAIVANVTEPPTASGVKTVKLYYKVNGQDSPHIDMTLNPQSNLWEANIPGQPARALVEYSVRAEDNAENIQDTETLSYTVALAGDANLDHVVDILDAATISAHWHPGPPIGPLGYDSNYDLNNDGTINIIDSAIVSVDWNKTW